MTGWNTLRLRAARALQRSLNRTPSARPPGNADIALVERLNTALARMPELTREIFMMHRFDDLDYLRIARRLGIGVDEVEAHMSVALKQLWRELRDDF